MPYITQEDDISVLPLSVRSQNCLRRNKIHTIGALVDIPADEFIKFRNMGQKSAEEVRRLVHGMLTGTGEYILVENVDSNTNEPAEPAEPADSAEPAEPAKPVELQERVASAVLHDPDASDPTKPVTIFLDETGAVHQDISVRNLPLSVRAKTCLLRKGYAYASQLVGISPETLMGMRNMGQKTVEEVLACVAKISVSSASGAPGEKAMASGSRGIDMAAEMCSAYGGTESIWQREILTVKAEHPEAMGETLIYRLYGVNFVRSTAKTAILQILEENNNELSKAALAEMLPQHLNNTTILEELLLELEACSAVEQGDVMVYRQYPSAVEFAAQIKSDRVRECIQERLSGKTLQEIGEQAGITRERVRQIIEKGLQKRPRLREDQYAYIFEQYDFSLEDFTLAYDEPDTTYRYLEMISQVSRSKKKPLEELLTDNAVAPELRKKAERAIYKQYVSADGVRIKMTRPELVRHYIKTNCKTLTSFDDFVAQYTLWLDSLGLGGNSSLTLEARSYENKLNLCDYVLWNQWRRFRYYNIPERDFEELLSTLDLEQFHDVEISALKLFRDHPDLMQRYDIQDEYELHNLLKKIWPQENSSVKFTRMPTIEIGTADPVRQVTDLFCRYSPVTADDLANHYEEEYGIKAASAKSNLLTVLDCYYYQGVYSVDFPALPAIQLNRMQAVLDRDFYTVQEITRLYKREFPTSDESLINPYTLKTLGFHVYSGYVVKKTYLSAADYFCHLLTADDIVDARNISKSILSNTTYTAEVYALRAAYKIIEFAPLQYVNIRRLNEAGVTTDDFESYCKAVARHYEKGEYFTVTSLRQDGFTHKMDDLGFDEWFYSSVLLEDREGFSYQRIGGTRVFLCGKPGASMGGMLAWLLEKRQKIDIYDLMELLESHYGIVLSKDNLLAVIDGTDLYYDKIMEAVYIDYNTYFEEI